MLLPQEGPTCTPTKSEEGAPVPSSPTKNRPVTCLSYYVRACVLSRFIHVWLFATRGPHQALLSMGFSRQEYWSGLPFPPPGDSS